MNEQELANLFSEQVDRLLQGGTPVIPAGDEELQGTLTLAKQLSQVRFRASPAGQAAFQSQLGAWFGGASERTSLGPETRRWNMMSGKLFALIISVFVTIVTAVATIVIAIFVVVRGGSHGTPSTPNAIPTATPISATVTTTPSLTTTVVPTGTLTPTVTPLPTLPGTIDTIETITVVVTVDVQINDLIPGLPPVGHDDDDDNDNDHHGDSNEHDHGHGNDNDHHDDD